MTAELVPPVCVKIPVPILAHEVAISVLQEPIAEVVGSYAAASVTEAAAPVSGDIEVEVAIIGSAGLIEDSRAGEADEFVAIETGHVPSQKAGAEVVFTHRLASRSAAIKAEDKAALGTVKVGRWRTIMVPSALENVGSAALVESTAEPIAHILVADVSTPLPLRLYVPTPLVLEAELRPPPTSKPMGLASVPTTPPDCMKMPVPARPTEMSVRLAEPPLMVYSPKPPF